MNGARKLANLTRTGQIDLRPEVFDPKDVFKRRGASILSR